jgi:macrolide transport system ATP-binding/permease protein
VLWHDLTYSIRALRRASGFTAVAVVTLGLGVGATTALFSHANSVLLKPIPVPSGDRIVGITMTTPGRNPIENGVFAYHLRPLCDARLSSLDGIAAVKPFRTVLDDFDEAQMIWGEVVTSKYFELLGVTPRLGRLLIPADDSGSQVMVIGERLWKSRFHGDPLIVGRAVRLGGQVLTIVGVVPEGFRGLIYANVFGYDVWLPKATAETFEGLLREESLYGVVARLRHGVSFHQADAEVRAFGRHLDPEHPEEGLALVRLQTAFGAPGVFVGMGTALLALSVLVMLIACANLTGLLLARADVRSVEIAIRVAHGASKRQILQLLMTEAGIVSLLGGGLGLVMAVFVVETFGAVSLPHFRNAVLRYDAGFDPYVFGYAFLATIVAAVAIGSAPARRASRIEPSVVLSSLGGGGGVTPRCPPFRRVLVSAQIGCSIVLLLVAGLFVRGTVRASSADPGFGTANVAIGHFDLSIGRYSEERGKQLLRDVVLAASSAPGVSRAALTSGLPIEGNGLSWQVLPEGRSAGLVYRGSSCRMLSVSPGFFDVLGLPLLEGRDFTLTDSDGATRVAVVSDGMASHLWPGEEPVGRRFRARTARGTEGPLVQVVGVVADASKMSRTPEQGRFLYLPSEQHYNRRVAIVVRGGAPGHALIGPLRTAVQRAVSEAPMFDVRTLEEHVGLNTTGVRLAAIALSALGCLGFVIALVGLYGVMAYQVTQRTREIAVRRLLGASSASVYFLVLEEGLWMLLIGVVPGLLATALLISALRPFVWGVPHYDWLAFTAVPLGLVVVGLAACLMAAVRAVRLNPSAALRHQ